MANSGDDQLWRDADAALDRLLDLPPEQRGRALAELSLSPALRDAVARLLAAHDGAPGVLDRIPEEGSSNALVGRRLGRWVLGEEIGRGGMSVVHRAIAADGTGQTAAVKLLTLSAAAGPGLERFRQEQAALARLRHVHIATLFESGVADDGTPWLAMALVDGTRIDDWCDARELTPRQRVTLFLEVCDAVAYAHTNLVIHRDLKPSNVLVDVGGEVRLLDFGIARLADAAPESTATQWRALTPEYAAPEQFAGAPPSTSMDVYGLGALLYRLLCGRPPRASAQPDAGPVPPPSRHRADLRQLRGDLDAIALQALAGEPASRYATVAALADDLRRWLDGLPVLAVRPSVSYRLRKWMRRHRFGAAAAAALLLVTVAGTTATLWQSRRATVQAELAAQNAARATAVRDFLVALFESADPEQAGGIIDTREIVAIGAQRAREEFEAQPALRAEMLRIVGSIQRRLGDYEDAKRTLDVAREAARSADVGVSSTEWALLDYERGILSSIAGDGAAARAAFEQGLQRIAPRNDAASLSLRGNLLGELATVAAEQGDFERAFAQLDLADAAVARLDPPRPHERVVVRNLRVNLLNSTGRFEEAYRLSSEILQEARGAGLESRGTFAQLLANASKLAAAAGEFEHAITHAEEGVAFAKQRYPGNHPVIADALFALGNAYRLAGRHDAAAPVLRDALARFEALALPGRPAEAAMVLGRSLVETGELASAVALAERYLPQIDADGERLSVRALGLLDVLLRASREVDRAGFARHADDAVARLDAMPEVFRRHAQTQRVRRRLAQWRLDDGDVAEAERLAEQGDDPAQPLLAADDLMLRVVAVRALKARGEETKALTQFERVTSGLATDPPLKPFEAETRLAVAITAKALSHPQRDGYIEAAERAHAQTPLSASLALQLAALRSE